MGKPLSGHLVAAALAVLAAAACDEEVANPPFPPPDIPPGALLGIFEGKFPCDDCPKLKTGLVLLQDPAARTPTTYHLREIGRHGNQAIDTGGTWTILNRKIDQASRFIYELRRDGGEPPIRYQKIDDNILLLLDAAWNPRVGNAAYSFTLSRTR